MRLADVTVTHFRGWGQKVSWRPGQHAVLVGPNSGGKTSLLKAIDILLDPHRDAYRHRLSEFDFFDLDTSADVEIAVVLSDLSPDDLDHFEPYVEGRRADGTFGGWDSPRDEFDRGDLVLRIQFRGQIGEPARACFARPEAAGQPVRQTDKIRIGWRYVPADLDPLHELAFYSNSVFSRLFERVDLTDELDAIRTAIQHAKGPLMAEPSVAETRRQLESSAKRLRLARGDDALDFAVAGLSDRRVLQSLQVVLRGSRSTEHLPLPAHGRGLLRVLLLTAITQHAKLSGDNLILAVEEPEQNLEPINQRLVARSLLGPASGAAQLLIASHSPDVVGTAPLAALHLVREFPGGPDVRALREASVAEHKFFERHARGPIVDGLYADAVLLLEGPTERGALPVLWTAHAPGAGLDERRIELIDCDSIDNIPSYARFFAELGIPVAVICDGDKSDALTAIRAANPEALIVSWRQHEDWEGTFAAECAVKPVASVLDDCAAAFGDWTKCEHQLRDCVRRAAGQADHLATATSISDLLAGYEEADQRVALTELLRGRSGLSFKTTMHARVIAQAVPVVPPSVAAAIDLVHAFVDDPNAGGDHDL
jgi:putative ATP-dependent endonuclease of OLD family